MPQAPPRPSERPPPRAVVAFGPEAPGWGSWDWVGADMAAELAGSFETRTFRAWELPAAEVVVLVKHAPPDGWAEALPRRARLVYAPVDRYGSAAEVDADATLLRRARRCLVHAERLRRYLEPYAPVEYLDHHVKFAAPMQGARRRGGRLLWVGVRTNLPPLVEWVNRHGLPAPLDVLSNFEPAGEAPDARELGFHPDVDARAHPWSACRQLEMTAAATAALDIKGSDFRSRHKPPAKGIDFVASGLPLAMNPESGTSEHLGRMGFEVADPLDCDRWLSPEYWEETRAFGAALRELLSRRRVAGRLARILDAVLAEPERGQDP